jgi:hypothetical protein
MGGTVAAAVAVAGCAAGAAGFAAVCAGAALFVVVDVWPGASPHSGIDGCNRLNAATTAAARRGCLGLIVLQSFMVSSCESQTSGSRNSWGIRADIMPRPRASSAR